MTDVAPTPLPAFALAAAALICTPGPGTMLTVHAVLSAGRRAAARTAGGVILGQAVWVVAAACGAAAVLQRSAATAAALAVAGAVLLTAFGIHALWKALRLPRIAGAGPSPAGVRVGLASNLLNPKMPLVAASLLPGAAIGRAHPVASTLLLGLLFCSITGAWLGLWIALAAPLRDHLPVRAVGAVGGAVLTAVGARLLVSALG